MTASKLGLQVIEAMGAGAVGGGITSNVGMALGELNNQSTNRAVNAAYNTGNAELIGLADVFDQKRIAGTADNFDLGALRLEVDYYNSLTDAQKLAYDIEPAVLDGTATLAEQMAYKIATGEKLTIAELNRLDRDHNAVPALGRLLGLNLNNTNYIVMRATLNSTATKNAKSNANLLKLEEQYQQKIAELEAAREQQRQAAEAANALDSEGDVNYNHNGGNDYGREENRQNSSYARRAQRGLGNSREIARDVLQRFHRGDGQDSKFDIEAIRKAPGERQRESFEEFKNRAVSDHSEIIRYGEKYLSRRLTPAEYIRPDVAKAVAEFKSFGVPIYVIDSCAEIHYKGGNTTVTSGEAFVTEISGIIEIYITNDIDIELLKETVSHELCHVAQLRNIASKFDYSVQMLVDLESENGQNILAKLYDLYGTRDAVERELPAYIAGWLSKGKDSARKVLGDAVTETDLDVLDQLRIDMMDELERTAPQFAEAQSGDSSDADFWDIREGIGVPEDEIIRDGSHMQDGKLKPNVTYQTGEYDYIYQTNSEGLISRVIVKALHLKKHVGRLKHFRNTFDKQQGDHAGHLVADLFGGSPYLDNLVSQAKDVNLRQYRKIESKWAKALRKGYDVSFTIDIKYDSNSPTSRRPTAFVVEYTITGVRDGVGFSKRKTENIVNRNPSD